MLVMEKVLLRKDIGSLIVAIVAGIATVTFLASVVAPFALLLSPIESPSPNTILDDVWLAVVNFALQLIALELLLRAVIVVRAGLYTKRGK